MGTQILFVLIWCTVGIAQPDDLTQNEVVGEWIGNDWYSHLQFLIPQQDRQVRVTTQESFDVFSRRYLFKQESVFPMAGEAGIFSFTLQVQERVVPRNPISFSTFDRITTIDQGTVRVAARWLDQRKDEIEASVSSRYDFATAKQSVETGAISLKAMLPARHLPWYLQGDLQADTEQARQATLSLAASGQSVFGSNLTANMGITSREYRKTLQQKLGSYIFNGSLQWKLDDHLCVGVFIKYYLDVHDVDAFIFLEIKSRGPGR